MRGWELGEGPDKLPSFCQNLSLSTSASAPRGAPPFALGSLFHREPSHLQSECYWWDCLQFPRGCWGLGFGGREDGNPAGWAERGDSIFRSECLSTAYVLSRGDPVTGFP